jgi:chromosome segregation ATPase
MIQDPIPGDLEVKPVKPLEVDTPEQIIERLRKELASLREVEAGLHTALTNALEDRDRVMDHRDAAVKLSEQIKKRLGEISAERERWKASACKLQEQVDAQKAERLVALIDERQKLRTDVGMKDKQIAELTQKLDAAQSQTAAARQVASQAQQRFAGLEASAEVLSRARDKAQDELAFADGIVKEIKMVLEKLGVDLSKTPPMMYPDAVKALYGQWSRANTALKIQVDSLLAKLPAPTSTPAPARKGA